MTTTVIEMIQCPTDPLCPDGTPHTIIGCGTWVMDMRDDEGIIDCPACGMFWKPEDERGYRP